MNIVGFLFVGLLAGWIASLLLDGHGLGALGDMVVGVVGAFVGGFIFNSFGLTAYGMWGTLGMSVVGAMAFLIIIRLFTRSGNVTGR